MFNLEQYPSILFHFKNLSRIFKKNNSEWYELFCPYCDDATRKANPNHGHFHLAVNYPFAHCFRCGYRSGLVKVLKDTGFTDVSIIQEIIKYGNIGYNTTKKLNISLENKSKNEILNKLYFFINKYPRDFLIWKDYIYFRCGEINPTDYYLIPEYVQQNLAVQIYNSSNKIVTNRFIVPKNGLRYYIPKEKPLYYFQNIRDINDYNNIIFCEGAFDLINLHRYSTIIPNDSFFISFGGSNYKQTITSIISNFLLIGKYNIYVIFDKNVKDKDLLMKQISFSSNILNPDIKFHFYEPLLFKDVSDFISLIKL